MKFSSLRAFEKHIDGAMKLQFPPLYLIASEGAQENRLAIDLLAGKIARKEKIGEFAIKRVKGGSVLDELNTLSFFSASQIIIVEDVSALSKQEEEAVLKGAPGTFIILSGVPSASAFYKKVEKEGVVLDLSAEKSWQKEKGIEEWIGVECAKVGKRIDQPALVMLARETKADSQLLRQELDKLFTFVDTRDRITVQDVDLLVAKGAESNIFELSESLFKADRAKAIKIMRNILSQGGNYFALLKQLRGQIETELKVASILKNGGTPQKITETFPYMKGFVLEKHLESVRRMGFERLKKALTLVDDFDLKGREGQPDYELLTDMLAAEFPC